MIFIAGCPGKFVPFWHRGKHETTSPKTRNQFMGKVPAQSDQEGSMAVLVTDSLAHLPLAPFEYGVPGSHDRDGADIRRRAR